MVDANYTSLEYETLDEPKQSMYYEFEKGFLIDGTPRYNFKRDFEKRELDLSLLTGDSVDLQLWAGIPICTDDMFGHYNSAYYDPQFASLFQLDSPYGDAGNNAPLAKSNKTTVIVAAAVSATVVVALAAFVIAVFASPTLQTKLVPTLVKSKAAKSSHIVSETRMKNVTSNATASDATPSSNPTSKTTEPATKTTESAKRWTTSTKPSNPLI